MTQTPRGYAQFVEIRQPPERVFAAFTDPAQIERWYAIEASVDPRSGGTFRVRLRDGQVRDATIDIWDPGRRLRLIYMPDARLPKPGGGPLVEDVLFDVKPGRTVVRVLGNGVPGEREWDAYFVWLRRGWTYWLHALKTMLEAELPPAAAR
jgi:uncharacterized protein YndB with AHSA1/START domain